MKCVEKYDARAKGASQKFWGMPIDHLNLFWNINFPKFPWLFLNFPDFQQNSKFPWLILKFPDFSLTLNFPDQWQPCLYMVIFWSVKYLWWGPLLPNVDDIQIYHFTLDKKWFIVDNMCFFMISFSVAKVTGIMTVLTSCGIKLKAGWK